MKKLYNYLLIGLLSIIFTSTAAFSQNIDTNRMNRDINIMENILSELFKAQISTSENGTVIVNGRSYFNISSTRGTYMPGFGIIFMVPSPNNFEYSVSSGGRRTSYSFYYDSDEGEEGLKVDQESITTRIEEFLRDYGSTIGQLKNDERVMVIYGSKSTYNSRTLAYRLSTSQSSASDKKEEDLPIISVSAKVSDLNNYRSGKINADNFSNRLAVATSENKEYLDLKVMGNIFETALTDQAKESFQLSGRVDYMMLDNFGALYSLDVRYNDLRGAATLLRTLGTGRRIPYNNVDTQRILFEQAQNNKGKEQSEADDLEQRKKELEENIATAYSNLVVNIKEYMIDYGRTLNSLNSDQFLLLSININGRQENIPGRLDVQIKKSVFDQLDKGSISREQALQKVVVTEY